MIKDISLEDAEQLCKEREFAMKVKEKQDREEEMSAIVRLLDLGNRYKKGDNHETRMANHGVLGKHRHGLYRHSDNPWLSHA